jgi:hypothetical protein
MNKPQLMRETQLVNPQSQPRSKLPNPVRAIARLKRGECYFQLGILLLHNLFSRVLWVNSIHLVCTKDVGSLVVHCGWPTQKWPARHGWNTCPTAGLPAKLGSFARPSGKTLLPRFNRGLAQAWSGKTPAVQSSTVAVVRADGQQACPALTSCASHGVLMRELLAQTAPQRQTVWVFIPGVPGTTVPRKGPAGTALGESLSKPSQENTCKKPLLSLHLPSNPVKIF